MELRPVQHLHAARFSGGEKVGCLTVEKALRSKHFKRGVAVVFQCRCDCGAIVERDRQTLIKRKPRYCGTLCRLKAGTAPPGCSKHSHIRKWEAMLDRCYNPNSTSFADYGARGIGVCERWRYGDGESTGLEYFAVDMGEHNGLTLERSNSDGNYEPCNCVWASRKTQSRNRRSLRLLEWRGETLPASAWAERQGIPYFTLMRRLGLGWPVERALTEAIHPR